MVLVEVGDDEPSVGDQAHMPAAFLRLLHSLQYFGQVIPVGTLFAALSAFQSAPQARSRAYSACRPSVGFLVAGAGFAAAVGRDRRRGWRRCRRLCGFASAFPDICFFSDLGRFV